MNNIKLIYPVISVGDDGIVYVSENEEVLMTMTAYALKKRCHDNDVIIDSSLKSYVAKGYKILGGKGTFWGYTNCLDRIVSVSIDIVERQPQLTFGDVKKMVIKDLRRQNSFRSGDKEWKEYMLKVTSAEKIDELMELIKDECDKRGYLAIFKKGLFNGF